MKEDRRVFSLIEITQSLRSVIERKYNSTYWIKAEIAKLNFYPRSGHCYPEIVEKVNNKVQAQIRCTIWGSNYQKINEEFLKTVGEPLKEGTNILFRASISFHPVYGLSLNIVEVEPSFTLGEMAREKQKTINKLQEENLYEKNKKNVIALLPSRIAIISVETSKGYNDFLKILNNYPRKFSIKHNLFPAILQGEKAVETVTAQLREINKQSDNFDAIAIIRGGGGDIGLNCYDSYQMAKEVATSPLPVITGIGHSTNETVVEMIAWENKITPTDVAYFIIQKFEDFYSRLEKCKKSLIFNSEKYVNNEKNTIKHLWGIISAHTSNKIQYQQYHITNIYKNIKNKSLELIKHQKTSLSNIAEKILQSPVKQIYGRQSELILYNKLINSLTKKQIKIEKDKVNILKNRTEQLNPEKVLERGYSITLCNNKRITSTDSVKPGDTIKTILHKGKMTSIIKTK